jgi:hypothetical protein
LSRKMSTGLLVPALQMRKGRANIYFRFER